MEACCVFFVCSDLMSNRNSLLSQDLLHFLVKNTLKYLHNSANTLQVSAFPVLQVPSHFLVLIYHSSQDETFVSRW